MTIDERAEGTAPIIIVALAHYQGSEIRPGYSKAAFIADLLRPMLIEAIKAERDAIGRIIDQRMEEIKKTYLSDEPDYTRHYKEGMDRLTEANFIGDLIHTRSES